MKLNDKLYCDICYKRVDNYVDPMDITYCYSNGEERHYCRDHCDIGEKTLYDIRKCYEDINNFEISIDEVKEYDKRFKELMGLPKTFDTSLKLPISKKEKIKRIYEDDDFIIDLFPEEKMVRVSVFDDWHFQDEVFIRKDDYCG